MIYPSGTPQIPKPTSSAGSTPACARGPGRPRPVDRGLLPLAQLAEDGAYPQPLQAVELLPPYFGANTMWYLQFRLVCAKLWLSKDIEAPISHACVGPHGMMIGAFLRVWQSHKPHRTPRRSGSFHSRPADGDAQTTKTSGGFPLASLLTQHFNEIIFVSNFFDEI